MLERDAASNRQIFESLLQRTKETGISGELKTSNIRVVDAAEMPRASGLAEQAQQPARSRCSAAPPLALGLAFFFEYLDNRIKTPDELKQHLGLPFLGMVPALFDKEHREPADQQRRSAELRGELPRPSAPTCCSRRPRRAAAAIVVTSTGPGEGKTRGGGNLRSRWRRPASGCC